MPLFMDQHDTKGASSEDLARAHENDLAVQDEYHVRFLTYWLDYQQGLANCLVEAPNSETVNEVHSVSHGLLANRVIAVNPSEVAAILGRLRDPDHGEIESATRTFAFTDVVAPLHCSIPSATRRPSRSSEITTASSAPSSTSTQVGRSSRLATVHARIHLPH